MKLSEVFSQLAFGELSQIALGGHSEGELTEANHPQLVAHVNLGLTDLYKRFALKEGRITVPLVAGTLTYPIAAADLLKIERVSTAEGWELGLNDEADEYACTTPSMSVLRVPEGIVLGSADLPDYLRTAALTLVYRANHPIIDASDGFFDPLTTELELPYSHLQALLYFIASRIHNPIGMTNEFHTGNNYAAKYEMACQQLEQFNLRVDRGMQNTRLRRNGWV